MKILFTFLILLFSSILIFPQTDSSNCKTLNDSINHRGEIWVQSMPKLIGGLDSLQLRLNYPLNAVKNKVEGKVYVKCIIDTNGFAICPEIIRGLGFGCDKEAIRLVETSRFIPSIQHNKKIIVSLIIPVIFKLPKK